MSRIEPASQRARVFVPGSIGNVGPGFDVLGLAFDGAGDRVTITLRDDASWNVVVSGRDAANIPADATRNTAAVAARAFLQTHGWSGGADLEVEKGLPLAGGMGGSAASSAAGAAAASFALFGELRERAAIMAAMEGEALVSGRHADNILPSMLGGLALVRSVDPLDYTALPVASPWWVTLVTPAVRIRTIEARAMLPAESPRAVWIQTMANTAMMVHAFAVGDGAMLRRALDDPFAEPLRKALIPHFDEVKAAALQAGSIGCSISGSGPTIFAIAPDEATAGRCAAEMQSAFSDLASSVHVGPIAASGARLI